MANYKVVETFVSINGEGVKAGQLAVFIRFQGCNLACSFCDTKWANEENASYQEMTEDEIYTYIQKTGAKNVTLTGGEPLLRKDMNMLLDILKQDASLYVEIETNGSVPLVAYRREKNYPAFTMDYKLPSSGMEQKMCIDNFSLLQKVDTVKFVAGSRSDLDRAYEIITKYDLVQKCHVYLSPVFGAIEPAEMVEYMVEHNMNGVNLQLQMHKFIWDPNKRGV